MLKYAPIHTEVLLLLFFSVAVLMSGPRTFLLAPRLQRTEEGFFIAASSAQVQCGFILKTIMIIGTINLEGGKGGGKTITRTNCFTLYSIGSLVLLWQFVGPTASNSRGNCVLSNRRREGIPTSPSTPTWYPLRHNNCQLANLINLSTLLHSIIRPSIGMLLGMTCGAFYQTITYHSLLWI